MKARSPAGRRTVVTACARQEPAVPDAVRTQHGPMSAAGRRSPGSIRVMTWDDLEYYGSGKQRWEPYICPYCARDVTGAVVASYAPGGLESWSLWVRCPHCRRGAVIVDGRLYPSTPFGPSIEGLPAEVAGAYEEARNCMGVGAFTAAELVCRKILMHIAVDKGATPGKPFVTYLDHLEKAGYVTPPMKAWVDLIRMRGNLATHEIPAPDQQQAESTVMFTAELLRLVYEMEHIAKRYTPQSGPTTP